MRHKFKATRTTYNGRSYPSKLQAAYAKYLTDLKKEGLVLFFLEEVPFRFYDTSKYLVDFMVFMTDGEIRFIETKGRETSEFNRKMKLMKMEYPCVNIIVVKGKAKNGWYEFTEEKVGEVEDEG